MFARQGIFMNARVWAQRRKILHEREWIWERVNLDQTMNAQAWQQIVSTTIENCFSWHRNPRSPEISWERANGRACLVIALRAQCVWASMFVCGANITSVTKLRAVMWSKTRKNRLLQISLFIYGFGAGIGSLYDGWIQGGRYFPISILPPKLGQGYRMCAKRIKSDRALVIFLVRWRKLSSPCSFNGHLEFGLSRFVVQADNGKGHQNNLSLKCPNGTQDMCHKLCRDGQLEWPVHNYR